MKRLHLHISVDHLEDSIRYYSTLFGNEPTVSKPDYAKWMLDDPRVNFAISKRGAPVGLNHLGIQVESAVELAEMNQRLQMLQTDVKEEMANTCCYSKSDKYWVTDPQGLAWETYHTLESVPVFGGEETAADNCCVPVSVVMMPKPGKKDDGAKCCG